MNSKVGKVMASINRGLRKLVGEENDILFHFVRVILACVLISIFLALAIWIVVALWKAVLILFAAIFVVWPYLAVFVVVVNFVAFAVFVDRLNKSQRLRERDKQFALTRQAEEQQRAKGTRIRQSVHAADEKTMNSVEAVLASLRRFDHRLELSITSAHYIDLFGDNWVNVREFAETSNGRKMPDVSGLLVEIIILYKQAQDITWRPENLHRMQLCWNEASRRRRWLSEIIESAETLTPLNSGPVFLEVVDPKEQKSYSIPEMKVAPPPVAPAGKARNRSPIPEMAVKPPASVPVRPQNTTVRHEIGVQSPLTSSFLQSPKPNQKGGLAGPAPKLSVPPTLEELQRYYIWANGND